MKLFPRAEVIWRRGGQALWAPRQTSLWKTVGTSGTLGAPAQYCLLIRLRRRYQRISRQWRTFGTRSGSHGT